MLQVTCDAEVEQGFLRRMRKVSMRALEDNVEAHAILPDIPETVKERNRQTIAHLETIMEQWSRCADAAKLEATRKNFTDMLPTVKGRLQYEWREEEARSFRERQREENCIAALQGKENRGVREDNGSGADNEGRKRARTDERLAEESQVEDLQEDNEMDTDMKTAGHRQIGADEP